MYDLFEHMSMSQQGGGGGGLGHRQAAFKKGGKPSRRKATVSSQFKVSKACLPTISTS